MGLTARGTVNGGKSAGGVVREAWNESVCVNGGQRVRIGRRTGKRIASSGVTWAALGVSDSEGSGRGHQATGIRGWVGLRASSLES